MKTLLPKLLFSFKLLLLPAFLMAQNVTVTPATASYPTLKAAFDAINAGTHTGNVMVSITGNTVETATAVLNASGVGAASYTSLSVTASNVVTVSGNIAGALVELNGADGVVIMGANSSGTINLSFSNTSTSANAGTSTIRLSNDATGNIITRCRILGSSTRAANATAATGNLLFTTGTATGNGLNLIAYNEIGSAGSNLPSRGVASLGSAAAPNNDNIVRGNLIYDVFNTTYSAAVYLDDNNVGWTIDSNRVYQTAPRTGSGTGINYGIRIDGNAIAEDHVIAANIIGYASSSGTGTYQLNGSATTFQAISYTGKPSLSTTTIAGNIISNVMINGTSGTNNGINITVAAGGVPVMINNNFISNIQTTGTLYAIAYTGAGSNQSSSFYGNVIQQLTLASAARFYGILYNGGNNGEWSSIDSNVVRNININGTASGSATGSPALCCIYVASGPCAVTRNAVGSLLAPSISVVQAAASTSSFDLLGIFVKGIDSVAIHNNSIAGLVADNTAATSGTPRIFAIRNSSSGAGAVSNNIIGGSVPNSIVINSLAPGTAAYGYYSNAGIVSFSKNIIRNITSGAGTGTLANSSVLGICNASGSYTLIDSNVVHTLRSIGASMIGILMTPAVNARVTNNQVYDVTGTSTLGSAWVSGIQVNGGDDVVVTHNKVGDLTQQSAFTNTAVINGIVISADSSISLFNNLVGNLWAPAANSKDAVRGISISSSSPSSQLNVFHNTVNISGSSTGTNFGSTAFFHSSFSNTSSFTIANNIFVNTAVPAGDGLSVAFRRWSGDLTAVGLNNYSNSSNNNLFYAGTPAANRVIYSDSINNDTTLAAFKVRVAPRESLSVTEQPPFTSATVSDNNFLHINPTMTTQVESGGKVLPAVSNDYDYETRWGISGYAGNGTAPDIGADEGNFTAAALPVELLSFTGRREGNMNILAWTTATENRNKGFEIERSADGRKFSTLHFVATKADDGNSTMPLNYSFIDAKPFAASNFYRLKQIDLDGSFTYSPVLSLNGPLVKTLSISTVYPNPAKDKVRLVVASPDSEKINLLIVSMTGEVVAHYSWLIQRGNNNFSIDVSKLSAGKYIVCLQTQGGASVNTSFVK